MKTFLGLSAVGLALLDLAAATASPKVFGMTFEKTARRTTAEANRLRKRQSKTVGVDLDNADIAYVINMTLGTPPQSFSVQIDTGSADIWVPAVTADICSGGQGACSGGAFDPDRSSTYQGNVINAPFSISYEDGSGVDGSYANDTLTVGQTTIQQMTFGLAQRASRPFGIMGIGYAADESIANGDDSSSYPNIVNQLKNQGHISTLAYSLWLNDLDAATGSILFGGIDTAKFHGPLTVLPIQKSATGGYTDFTVVASAISLVDGSGASQFSQSNLALPVILDSGTTATYVPDNIAQPILAGVGAINDPELGQIVPCNLAGSPDVWTFGFGGSGGPVVNISFSEFVMPISNDEGDTYQFIDTGEQVCGWGLLSSGPQAPNSPILLGDTFLRSAYVVYDLTNNQIGIAQTNFNATDSNVVEISGSAIPSAAGTATAAAAIASYTGHPLEQGHTRSAASGKFSGSPGKPTFNLGITMPSATGGSGSGHKNGGNTVSPPVGMGTMGTVVTGTIVVLSMIFGGSLIAVL